MSQELEQKAQDALFTELLAESGMPTTEAEINQAWADTIAEQAEASGEEMLISNNSAWSPFWRLITSIVAAPVLWINKLMVRFVLPNSFVKYASGKWLDLLAWAVDLERTGAEFAQGQIVFARAGETTQGDIAIPAGTVIESPNLSGKVYRVFTLADALIPDGAASVRVDVLAEDSGTAYNLGPGYYTILPKSVPGVASASNDDNWLVVAGRDQQSDASLRLAIRNQWAAVAYFHTDAAYRVIINQFSGIPLNLIFFEKEAPRGPATANAYVMLESGVPSQDLVDSINAHITTEGEHGHGDDLLCLAIPVQEVNLSTTVYPQDNLTAEQAEALRLEAENIIRCAFRENLAYSVTKVLPRSRFSFSRLDDELHSLLPTLASVEITRAEGSGDIVAGLALPQLASLSVVLG